MKSRSWLILVIILIVLATRNVDFIHKIEKNKVEKVKVSKLGKENMSESLTFQGVVVPKETIPLYVEVPVTVEDILVRNGSSVKAGDPLLEFSLSIKGELERELEGINLDLNNINLELRDLSSGSLKLELENRTLEIKSLRADIKAIERSLGVLRFESQTLREQANAKIRLLENDGISSIEANAALTDANRKEAELTDQISNLDISRQKYELLVLSYERLKRELNLKESTLKISRRKLMISKNDLETKLKNVTEPLRSPIDGLVAEIFVEEGVPFAKGKKLISIVPEGSYMIKLEVPIYRAAWIERGEKAVITLSDSKNERTYEGVVEKVAQGAKIVESENFQNKVVEVYIDLQNTDGLKLGYYTSVNIKGKKIDDSLTVNSFSVLEEEGGHYVYTMEDGTAKKTLVEIGKRGPSRIEILNLPEGTPIIVNPFKVTDGEKIMVEN